MLTQTFDKVLVSNWREAPKFVSLWFFLLLGLSPELFQLAVSHGLLEANAVPAMFSKLISWVAFLGAAGRMINQAAVVKGMLPNKTDDTEVEPPVQ